MKSLEELQRIRDRVHGQVAFRSEHDASNGASSYRCHVLVCGGMMLAESSFLSNAAFANEDVLLNSVNTITGNEDAIVISGKSVQSDSLTLTQSAAMTMMVIFVIAIPVLTLVICLVVFIKRRHL